MRARQPLISKPLWRSGSRSESDAALRLVDRGLEIATDAGDRHALTCLKGELLRDLGDIVSSTAIYRQAIAAVARMTKRCAAPKSGSPRDFV